MKKLQKLFVITITVAVVYTATLVLQTKKDVKKEPRKTFYVAVHKVKKVNRYVVKYPYVGKIAAKRTSQVGFEISGQIESLVFDEGDFVRKGQKIATLNVDRLLARKSELISKLKSAKANLELAKLTLNRFRNAKLGVSFQNLDEAQQNYYMQKANVSLAQAQIKTVEVDIKKSTLFAPFTGTISKVYIDLGQVVSLQQPVIWLMSNHLLEAQVGITREGIDNITIGKKYPIEIHGRKVTAVATAILPNRTSMSRTIDVIFDLPRLEGVAVGDLAVFYTKYTKQKKGTWIPISSLVEGVRGLWSCYVAVPQKHQYRLVAHPLQIHAYRNNYVFVESNLRNGDYVVSTGIHRVTAGKFVQILESQP
ncbi:efflux RND transporter periplasmic adaptor subunit [Candidatus Uabimicrobium amorphum]|uniref:RND transporter MFP subunit n=1 Tax=Uabimicrobium amorphum TaxID=2596890 RepID=A0A5S9F1U8_UABAM|nr:efflux RND transporter periplasmic adaptor subunit [Candidatus Uabimicrobium amorphum]BBM82443.1 RND transporter MFP subunit [Candidatus Uabimicrobium amorphum]